MLAMDRLGIAPDEAALIDYDRTLSSVEAAEDRLKKAAGACGLGMHIFDEILQENDGGSFSPLKAIQRNLCPDRYQKFCETFVLDDTPLLYSDTEPFLDSLDQARQPHFIVTYGVDPDWQRLKLAAAFKERPIGYTVMPHPNKSDHIMSLRNTEGRFDVLVADTMAIQGLSRAVLIDDKAVSFTGLPTDCRGYWLQRGPLIERQMGEVPANVHVVTRLAEQPVKATRQDAPHQVYLPSGPQIKVIADPWKNLPALRGIQAYEYALQDVT